MEMNIYFMCVSILTIGHVSLIRTFDSDTNPVGKTLWQHPVGLDTRSSPLRMVSGCPRLFDKSSIVMFCGLM